MGVSAPNPKTARVLELGATYGGNIISQALFNPDATFVGIELSQEQVEKGNEVIANAGLTNVSLVQSHLLVVKLVPLITLSPMECILGSMTVLKMHCCALSMNI